MQEFSCELMELLTSILKRPIFWISIFYSFFTFGISFRFVMELSNALETIGIKIAKRDRKKWRKLFTTTLIIIFFIFLFFYSSAVLLHY